MSIVLTNPRRMPPRTKSGRFRKRKKASSKRRRSTTSRRRRRASAKPRRRRRRSGTAVSVSVRRNPRRRSSSRKLSPGGIIRDLQRVAVKGFGLSVAAQGVRIAESWMGQYLWGRIIPRTLQARWRYSISMLLTTVAGGMLIRRAPIPKILKNNWEEAGAFLAIDSLLSLMTLQLTGRVMGAGVSRFEPGPSTMQGLGGYSPADYGMIGDDGYSLPMADYGVLGDWETELDAGMGDYVTVPEADYRWID